MFHHNRDGGIGQCHNANNYVKKQISNNNHNSHINQASNKHLHHQSVKSASASFIKLLNPFSKSKSHTISADKPANSDNCDVKCEGDKSNEHKASVKVLKQFWNEQIKTAKSTEHLHNILNNNNRTQKSATLKYLSQSNDSINEPKLSRAEKALTLDGSLRLPLDDFNKYKDANFIKNKKIKLLDANVTRSSRPESCTFNDNFYPQISSSGGKIHWAKREEILNSNMSVKNKNSVSRSPDGMESKSRRATRSDSVASSAGSIASNTSSLNSANRKFSFKTNPATTASYMNKKLSSNGGTKVAQIAQRFNQMIQQDATILEEVKKRGTVVLHHTGGRVYKIKEEKVDKKKSQSTADDATSTLSDDAISLPSIGGKNSTRRKSTLKKRPSIRIMVESSSRKDNTVLSKRQLYEANIVNKETIVLKPKVPDKSERVLAKTKELKSKKLNQILKTERQRNDNNLNRTTSTNKFALNKELNNVTKESTSTSVVDSSNSVNNELLLTNGDAEETSEPIIKDTTATQSSYSSPSKNNLRKIYDKITFRPTFLYGKKVNSKVETGIQQESTKSTTLTDEAIIAPHQDHKTIEEEEENVVAEAAESNKTAEIEDELEFKPIDLNLNVYFNNENLSTTNNIHNEVDAISANNVEDKNASSQGSQNDVTKNDKPDLQQPLMKPNESFLFSRSLSATKFENPNSCDTFSFIRGMLEAENLSPKIEENNYEIISRDEDSRCSEKNDSSRRECVDIDKNKRDDNEGVRQDCIEEENIYQSLCEVKGSVDDAISIKSYESFENYDEIKQSILDNKISLSDILKSGEDDYIFPEASPPQLPAPRKNTIPKISSPILTSTTSNLVQANNLPKLQKSNSCTSTTYEKIKYDQLPSKHSAVATQQLPLPPRNSIHTTIKQIKHDENIYDTIKSGGSIISTEYEKITEVIIDNVVGKNNGNDKQEIMADTFDINDNDNPYKNSKNDTMSIISNCYESISLKQSYSTINQILRHAISSTTLTSEHRINSIYGESMAGQSLTPPSDRSGGSDNSDEWIDVDSEEEEEETENNDRFIVICKKTKTHRSPDWSRLIRQKLDEWDDDSDHHYESLYSIQQQRAALEGKLENAGNKQLGLGSDNNIGNTNGLSSNYFIDKFDNDDDYSSFESDDENSRDGDLEDKSRGVDINCTKLPEPPQSTGQVYAFVQRIKNFGSISKNEISKGISKIAKKRSSLSKMPTSKFYETCDIPEDPTTTTSTTTTETSQNYIPPLKYDNKSIGKKSRGLAKLSKLGRLTINKLPTNFNLNDPDSDYQTSRIGKGNNENNSSLNLSENDVEFQNQKNNKSSFASKFRKSSAPSLSSSSTSNIYGSLASKNSTFYVTDSVDVDSGIFAVNEKSTSSPDNSNLNLSSASNSSNNITCDPKRRSIASISASRPKDSPPPPPPSDKVRRSGASSWYAECGLFKSGSGSNVQDNDEKGEKIITSWYHESGLYHTSNNSVASSSGSSGVSTGGECSPCGDENSHSMFLNEPLYQLYTAAKLESISSSEFEQENESDGYEEIHKKEREENENKKQPSRPSALQLIEPNHGPSRTLWCEVQEVIQSGVLSSLTINEKKLQEAKFEILTSEASYLKSLNLLKSHFMNHPAFRDPQNLDPQDRKTLFSYIIPVQECSDRLLCDLESCWQDSIMLKNLAKSIFKHAEKNFHVYISYCEHQGRLDRTLKRLKENNTSFKETLDILENDPVCCGLTIHSFLMLPMQRITRLPLLIDAVMTKLKSNDEEFDDWKMAMAIANKIVDQCNQAANRCEQAFEMETLSKQIEFQQNITPFPLIPFTNANGNSNNNRLTRTLVRRGELVHIIYRGDDAKLTFGKKATVKKNIYCFLFTDVIILTKKKSDESFVVFDYCQRSLLQLSSGDVIPQFPAKDINQPGKYIMFMSLLENHAGKPVDLILACPSETERQRWLQATAPPTSDNPYETLYEQWDCPQVVIKHSYQALEPDELTLDVGDVVNVLRKMKDDGWYFGERIRDGAQGWFPGNHSEEVHSAHVRARNLKQRHRLLLYTATYLESQKDANVKKK